MTQFASPTVQSLIQDPIGNYPFSTVACFDATTGALPRRRLDHDRMGEFLVRIDTYRPDALLIGASTGQGHLRTFEELEEWFRVAAAAKASDGQFFRLQQADRLLASLPPGRHVRVESMPPEPLWNLPLLPMLFVTLLASEWLLRKRFGLI